MPWETVVYRRKELYEQVWSAPTQQVAKKYGISDVALAKICRRLEIPKPGRGYWAKKAAGIAVKMRPLLPSSPGQVTEHRVSRWREPDGDVIRERREKRPREAPIPVDLDLTNPHPLIKKALRHLRKSEDRWDQLFQREACLDLRATGEALDRGLRVMDALLKALSARGYAVEVTEPTRESVRDSHRYGTPTERIVPSKTGVHIGAFFVEFGIEELVDIVKLPPPRPKPGQWVSNKPEYERIPNGKLALKIRSGFNARSTFADGKKQRVELLLSKFVEALLDAAEAMRLNKERREREHQEWLEASRRREEEARRRELEQKRRGDLQVRLAQWTEARDIRAFIAFARSHASSEASSSLPDSDFGTWSGWAEQLADRLEAEAISGLGSHQKTLQQQPSLARPWGQASG